MRLSSTASLILRSSTLGRRGFGLNPFAPSLHTRAADDTFDWSSLQPDDNLTGSVPCFDKFLCGRLNVPLDYSRPDESPKAIIAVIISPAPDRGAGYKGSILFNPGGPGSSGIDGLQGFVDDFHALAGPGYDIVSFDPRGVGATYPKAQCFTASEWAALPPMPPNYNSRDNVALYLAYTRLIAKQCEKVLGGNGKEEVGGTVEEWGPGRFMDSWSVANDMLSIVHALGQEKLNFIGASYGTALGSYFAAMHPDKVGLMMLDGNLDAEARRAGLITDQIRDSDDVAAAFFYLCTQAGPTVCPIAEPTVSETSARVFRIVQSLVVKPLVIIGDGGSDIFTADTLSAEVTGSMFSPRAKWPGIAELFAQAELRNVTYFIEQGYGAAVNANGPVPDQSFELNTCGDRVDQSHITLDEAFQTAQNATKISPFADDFSTQKALMCIYWTMRAKNFYSEPLRAANMSGKMLVTNNILDHTTPAAHAEINHERFSPSELILQNTVGHATLGDLGKCLILVIQKFFQQSELPASGQMCQPDALPLVGEGTQGIYS